MKRTAFLGVLAAVLPSAAAGAAAPRSKSRGVPKTVTLGDGLKYVDVRAGKGPQPRPGQVVTVHYTGTLTDGTKFDSSRDRGEPFSFPIGQGRVIPGWDEGVATMRAGGRRILTVPARLAYGDQGAGDKIPPGATLIFDIELLKIE